MPTEYLYYYYRPEVALAHMKRAGSSRGQHVARLTEEFFADLSAHPAHVAHPVHRYEQYLSARDGSYMSIETGKTKPRIKPDWAELSGYDKSP